MNAISPCRLAGRPGTALCTIVAAGFIAAFSSQALSQEASMPALLSGSLHPLSVRAKELDSSWRRVLVQARSSVRDNIAVNVSGNSAHAVSQNNIVGSLTGTRAYVTKGETVAVSGRVYLLAYHLQPSTLDLTALLQALATKTPPALSSLTPDTELSLSLLDLQTTGSLEEVRVFNLAAEMAESQKVIQAARNLFSSDTKPDKSAAPARPAPLPAPSAPEPGSAEK